MSYIINLPTFKDTRGNLTVVERLLPFEIKRFYYIYDVSDKRGGHRHKKTIQALICLGGSCEIYLNDGIEEKMIVLDTPNKCLIVEPKDWHTMDKFSQGSTLFVFASEYYDRDDYIDEEYK
jgi:dTDP-4-dehydrorhamnose 3,5-epimerase-like enzyme